MEIRQWIIALALLAVGGLQAQNFTEQGFSFNIVDVTTQDTMRIAGTLTLPYGVEDLVPAVILITGSGVQNRDEELMGHKPFKVIAEYLSARGYAVLRCDDRGVGESTGDMVHATTLDFAQDVEFQLDYLLMKPELFDPQRIFLFGHSEGATVAAIVAARRAEVAGVAMLGGAGDDGKTILLQQNEALFRLRGVADSLIERRLACMRDLFAVCDTLFLGEGMDTVKTLNMAFRPLFKQHATGLTKEQKQQCGLTNTECYGWAVSMATPWLTTFLTLNPADYIAKMRCPLLAIGGEKDCQVPADENLRAIERVCKKNRVKCSIVQLKDVNHLGQVCETGSPEEYAALGQSPDGVVLNALVQWLDYVCGK
ncbi:MAG: alpha/beta hydrolase [Bacteroidales bacterium]|nr:alpha/beta hydrolase [Bacteroidales bacterium]